MDSTADWINEFPVQDPARILRRLAEVTEKFQLRQKQPVRVQSAWMNAPKA
jgi:hypothetical protein